jgi:tetratricopeptide (TPR) repeat protein
MTGNNNIGYIYLRNGDTNRARQAARNAAAAWRDGYSVRFSILLAAERGDTKTAEELLTRFEKRCEIGRGVRIPARYYYYLKGQIAMKKGHIDEAIEDFKQTLSQLPEIWEIDALEDCLANAFLELGRLNEAIYEYERVLRLNPNYPLAHYHLAQAYEKKGLREKSIGEYARFLEIWKNADPGIPEVLAARRATELHPF